MVAYLKGNLVVELFVEGLAAAERLRAPKVAAPALALARAVALFSVKHGQLPIETLQHDLGRVAFLSGLVFPFARLQRALEIDLRPFAQILLGDAREILVEDDHAVPLGLLAPFAGRLVAPAVAGRHAQIHDGRPSCVWRTSGSAPRLPMRMTLLTDPAMT